MKEGFWLLAGSSNMKLMIYQGQENDLEKLQNAASKTIIPDKYRSYDITCSFLMIVS